MLVVLITITAALVAVWLTSTGDIVRARVQARALSLPTTWQEMGIVESAPNRIADWQRLQSVVGGLKSYHSSGVPYDKRTWKGPGPGSPVTPELIAHHAGLDAVRLAELIAIVDRLGEGPVVMSIAGSPDSRLARWDRSRFIDLGRIMVERIVIAPPELLAAEVRRALSAGSLLSEDGLTASAMRSVVGTLIFHACASRLEDLRRHAPGIEDDILRFADGILRSGVTDSMGELVQMFTGLGTSGGYDGNIGYGIGISRSVFGVRGPRWMWDILEKMVLRAGRARLMEAQIGATVFMREHQDLADIADECRRWDRMTSTSSPSWTSPTAASTHAAMRGRVIVAKGIMSTCLHGRLLAAEIAQRPWPVDGFDPARAPLKRIERGGALIGAYSTFLDGADDKGSIKLDRCWALYERLGMTMAGDPPPVR